MREVVREGGALVTTGPALGTHRGIQTGPGERPWDWTDSSQWVGLHDT